MPSVNPLDSLPSPNGLTAEWWDSFDGHPIMCFATYAEAVARQRYLAALVEVEYETDEDAWKDFIAFREATVKGMQ